MGWLPRRKKDRAGTLRTATSDDLSHLSQFVASRTGVEAYIEPRTAVTEATVVLVASTGEWTRRRIDGAAAARSFTKKHAIPLYDAGVVGYPKRMREWTARRKDSGEAGSPGVGPSV
ncbi:MAG: oxidoreductase [Pseudonocardiales bacterium]